MPQSLLRQQPAVNPTNNTPVSGPSDRPPIRTTFDEGGIPAELRARDQWTAWLTDWDDEKGKWDKRPCNATGYNHAPQTDPAVWISFARAKAIHSRQKGFGIGFAVSAGDPYCGIDLDHCIGEDGQLDPWADRLVYDVFQSYTERTVSGRGVRIWIKGHLPPESKNKWAGFGPEGAGAVELYDRKRFFTVTGDHLPGTPATIEDRSEELRALVGELTGRSKGEPRNPWSLTATNGATGRADCWTDEELLDRARSAKNGDKFRALFDDADVTSANGDHSRADYQLVSRLAFWTGPDAARIDRLFRQSALMRDKWDSPRGPGTYGSSTIDKALSRCGPDDFYRAKAESPGPNESGNDPFRLARLYRDTHCRHPEGSTLRYWQGEWFRWNGVYRAITDNELRAEIGTEIKGEFDRLNIKAIQEWEANEGLDEKGKPVAKPTAHKVTEQLKTNTLGNLASLTLLKTDDANSQPAWIDGVGPWPAEEILPARNALVHLPSLVEGRPATCKPTPRFFSTFVLDYDLVDDAPEPVNWLTFLGARPIDAGSKVRLQLWPDDPQSIATLQEWMGYLLLPDTTQQKIAAMIGPRRSGKGTIARVIRAMVGPDNVTGPTLSCLASRFGLAPLIGKHAAIIDDARLSGRTDQAVITERLLTISGEGLLTIDRKNLPAWSVKLPTRFTIISNELPRLTDSSGALAGRLILLRLTRSFYGKEDPNLTALLMGELPGIARWAIEGWKRLRERGYFVQPDSGKELVEEMEALASPIGAFLDEFCIVEPGRESTVAELFERWRGWCQDRGQEHAGRREVFGRDLRAALPHLSTAQVRRDGKVIRVFKGVGLAPRVQEESPAVAWLRDRLKGGLRFPAGKILDDARQAGHEKEVVFDAMRPAGIVSEGLEGKKLWSIPVNGNGAADDIDWTDDRPY